MKPTPGPWALAWEDGKHGVVGATTEGKLVAIVGNNPNDDKNDERRANAQLIANAPDMLAALQLAYRKHHLGDESIGWEELSDTLLNVLCEAMGDAEFQAWMDEVKP